jgi:hypothetical protein
LLCYLKIIFKKFLFVLFAIILYPSPATCQVIFSSPLSNRIANYRIRLELDTRQKLIVAQQQLSWLNNTSNPANELRFHLYLNAFKNMQSTFFKDSFWTPERLSQLPEDEFGSIDIQSMVLNDDADITENIEFIRPDDQNDNDSTVIQVVLPKPVLPGQQIKLSIDFTAKLPRIFARTGTVNDFYLLGQWFPKIGVFENGRWNCHQFFRRSEFYADFGVYEVELTLPRQYEVGATGILENEIIGDSLKTLFFRAEDVHDFAITAWPEYLRDVRKIAGVDVILLYAPEHQGQIYRYFSVIEAGLQYMAEWLMPYPYPQLTLVDPPLYALQAAGME